MSNLSERQPPADGVAHLAYRTGRKVVVGILGVTIVLVGIAMLVLPGPAVVVIPLGLGVLSLEFAFARRWLARARAVARRATTSARLTERPEPPPKEPATSTP